MNRYWIVFYQTLQDYSGGVALLEPNKREKDWQAALIVWSLSVFIHKDLYPFVYVILFCSRPPPTRGDERSGLYTEPMKDMLYECSSSHPTLLLLLCTLNQAISPSLYLLSWKLVSLACDVLMKRPASVKRVKLISFEYHNLLIPLTQCTSFTCDMDGTFSK